MNYYFRIACLTAALLGAGIPICAQGRGPATPVATDAPYQVRYAANLQSGPSYVDIINDGANGAPLMGPGLGPQPGIICVNVYFVDPGEELLSCCSCTVTANQTVEFTILPNLGNTSLTGETPPSVTVKLVGETGACTTGAAATVTTPAGGFVAFGTTLHRTSVGSFVTTETPFLPAGMSAGELASLTGRCAAILGNGSGFGICGGCNNGALGASKQ
jgi:hypothetical protein